MSEYKTFVELVAQRTPANARNDLDVYSKAETLAAIPPVDFGPVEADIAAISGDVYTLQGDISDLNSLVSSVSGALTTDLENLDISLTQKIVEDCLTSEAVSGSASTVTGYLKIYLNGVEYKLGIVN